ncbi:P-loop containing nucleoside triphosphate hydrolase protein [Phlyctochytrium arcticum]|nr:P-loop containing nucleoside triphosphate hydrolase protein [Phlyctochytrium arcticum]
MSKFREKSLNFFTSTFHAYGLRTWRQYLGVTNQDIRVVERKTWILMPSFMHKEQILLYGERISALVRMAKLHCVAPQKTNVLDQIQDRGYLRPNNIVEWRRLAVRYGVKPNRRGTWEELIRFSRLCYELSIAWAGGGQSKKLSRHGTMEMVGQYMSDAAHNILRQIESGAFTAAEKDQILETLDTVQDSKLLLDFDDMLYLPLVHPVKFKQYPIVMVDEAQDMSSARAALISHARAESGRLFLFGDLNQQIYQFAGAANNFFGNHIRQARDIGTVSTVKTMDDLEKSMMPVRTPAEPIVEDTEQIQTVELLPLTHCRRCPTTAIDLAKRIVPSLRPHKNAKIGSVKNLGADFDMDLFHGQPTMILSRTRKPMINFAFFLLAQGFDVEVAGRQIGKNLRDLLYVVEQPGERFGSVPALEVCQRLLQWRKSVTEDGLYQLPTPSLLIGGLPGIDDRLDSLLTLIACELFWRGSVSDIEQLLSSIQERRKTSTVPPIMLCTMHHARGLERDNIVVLNEMDHIEKYQKPKVQGRKSMQYSAEQNLMYIAYTRTKNSLAFIEWNTQDGFEEFEYFVDENRCALSGTVIETRRRPYLPRELLCIPENTFITERMAFHSHLKHRPAEFGEATIRKLLC